MEARMVTLHKYDNGEDIVWLIKLDGVNTKVGITEIWMQYIRKENLFDVGVESVVNNLAVKDYVLTETEKTNSIH